MTRILLAALWFATLAIGVEVASQRRLAKDEQAMDPFLSSPYKRQTNLCISPAWPIRTDDPIIGKPKRRLVINHRLIKSDILNISKGAAFKEGYMVCDLLPGENLRASYVSDSTRIGIGPDFRPAFIPIKDQEILASSLDPGVLIDIWLDSERTISRKPIITTVCDTHSACYIVVALDHDELLSLQKTPASKQAIYVSGGEIQ